MRNKIPLSYKNCSSLIVITYFFDVGTYTIEESIYFMKIEFILIIIFLVGNIYLSTYDYFFFCIWHYLTLT